MKTQFSLLSFSMLAIILFSSCSSSSTAQNDNENSGTTSALKLEVIQFHSEHRCNTCLKIEELTKEALQEYPSVPFSLVNVDDEKNEAKAEEFEAFGTSLYLFSPSTGSKKDLTDFAFMNAENKEDFIAGLKKEIEAFLKS